MATEIQKIEGLRPQAKAQLLLRNIHTFDDLLLWRPQNLQRLENIGPRTVEILADALVHHRGAGSSADRRNRAEWRAIAERQRAEEESAPAED